MSYVKREMNFSFTLANGKTFDESGTNKAILQGLRASARIIKAGGRSMSTMQLSIYGMSLSMMNQLSTLGMKVQLVPRNLISVVAGDRQNGMFLVFTGNITNAYADFQGAPDVPFQIEAHAGLSEAVNSAEASVYQGSSGVAGIMSELAGKMGLTFENNGVEKNLNDPYLYGSYRDQAYDCAQAAGINCIIDNGKLAIWNKNGAREGQVPLISPSTGMVGYPSYTAQGIMLKTIFNPKIVFGGKIQVESENKPANGEWAAYMLDYELEALTPRGRWFCNVGAFNPSFVAPVTR